MRKFLDRTGTVAFAALLMLVLLGGNLSTANAQTATGTILGTVQDATGAVIPGTDVTVRNVETGFTRTQPTGGGWLIRIRVIAIGNLRDPGLTGGVPNGTAQRCGGCRWGSKSWWVSPYRWAPSSRRWK